MKTLRTFSVLIGLQILSFKCIMVTNEKAVSISLIDHTSDNDDDYVVNCTMRIIKDNFNDKPTVLIGENKDNQKHKHSEFYENLTKKLIRATIPIVVTDDIVLKSSMYLKKGYILSIKYIQDCENEVNIQANTIVEKMQYLIVIFDISKKNCVTRFEKVAKKLSKYDITYMVKNTHGKDYTIITFLPQINTTTCAEQYDLPATVLATCSSNEKFTTFPSKKPQDFKKCPFHVGMGSMFPFSRPSNSSQILDPLYGTRGSDFQIMNIMAEYFNFTVYYYHIFKDEEDPFVKANFVNFLLNGTLDACAGGLYRIYGDVVDYSGVYGRQAIFWVYTANRVVRSWQNFVSKVNGLYIFMIYYACYSMIWYMLCMFDKQAVSIGNMLLYGWGALLGTSSLQGAITLKQKILNIAYLVMCIHLSAYISIQMYSFLTIVGPPPNYKTNADLIASGMTPYLIARLKYFVQDDSYLAVANSSEECFSYAHCEELSMKNNGMTVLIDGRFTLFQANTAVNDEARALRVSENILTTYHEMLLRKDGAINKNFQRVMLRLAESGISDKLYNDVIGILNRAKAESAEKRMLSFSYSCEAGCSITLAQLAGACYLWLGGCLLSTVFFVVELLLKRTMRNSQNSQQHDDI